MPQDPKKKKARSSKPLDTSPKPSGIGPAWIGAVGPIGVIAPAVGVRVPKTKALTAADAKRRKKITPAQKKAGSAAAKAAKAKLAARAKKKK